MTPEDPGGTRRELGLDNLGELQVGGGVMRETLADAIKRVQADQSDLTGAQIAERAGISAAYYADIRRSQRIPPTETISRIAAVLDTPAPPLLWLWVREQLGDELARDLAGWIGEWAQPRQDAFKTALRAMTNNLETLLELYLCEAERDEDKDAELEHELKLGIEASRKLL